jgi:Tol biopolymer transport system component/imidazolonepropionase-like amidohydrolase
MRHTRLAIAAAFALAASAPFAADAPAWDVNAEHGPTKTVRFTTDEGTWLDLDVSPDGRSIVFSMLGDLYRLPIHGGRATRLTSGPAWDVQPRYSPDGREIAYTSDRDGGNNLWRMRADGSGATQVTKERFRLLNNPAWTPDGQYLIGRKHFTGLRSLGAGELWLYHRDGGDGLQLTKQKNDQQDLGEPAVSPDGRYVYFSEDVSAGPSFQYNKDPHGLIYAIKRLDRQTGEIETLVSSPGGAVRPQPSPDGKTLAFVKRVREKSVLHLMDLDSGQLRPLWDGLERDQQEGWAIFGPYANFDWTPDGAAVVVWGKDGKFWRVDAASGEATNIPFTAEVEQRVTEAPRQAKTLPTGTFEPRMIRDVATSIDGRRVAFHAVGRLWLREGRGPARAISDRNDRFEYQPAFSPDGTKLLFTTWNDETRGQVVERDLTSGSERVLTTVRGIYYGPRYAPDGQSIVFVRDSGNSMIGSAWGRDAGLYVMPAAGGEPRKVADDGREPQFNADGSRVLYLTGGGLSKKLMSVGLHGEQPREVLDLKYVDAVSVSPDGKQVAFTELFNAYVAPLPETGAAIALSKDTKAVPVTALTTQVGAYLHWSDADSLHWMAGGKYVSRDLGATRDDGGVAIAPDVAVDTPTATVAITGGRVITMRDAETTQEVIEDGVVLVRGDRIVAVGRRGEVAIPEGARVLDAAGKTVVPGFVDAHAHSSHFFSGVIPQANWTYYANLAFGITTMFDPSATTETVFSQAELVQAGRLVGPRVYSTGTILYGADGDFKAVVNSIDDARNHLGRLQANGAFAVKSYNQPRRDQRQQINQAARELGMMTVEEGGSTLQHNLTMIVDGSSNIEHNLPVAPLRRDVVELWRQTDVRNTPTLVVSFGGLSGEYWWYARENVWENERLQRFFPRETLDSRSIRRELGPDWDYWHVTVAESLKTLRDAGVGVQVGGHGQLQGLAPHWEMWMLGQGGFTNFEALRAFTIDGADHLGFAKDLGSLETGKKADLVILDGNPLEDLKASSRTSHVMVNGRLFDATTMAEIGGRETPAPTFYWQRLGNGLMRGAEWGPTAPCHCPKGHRAPMPWEYGGSWAGRVNTSRAEDAGRN